MMHGHSEEGIWLTTVSFSSIQGRKCILASGRVDGSLVLQSTSDSLPRFEVEQPLPISCLSWRPTCTMRQSRSPFNPGVAVETEDLLVGDETGTVYYYLIEWPRAWEVSRDNWPGSMTLVAKVTTHNQQICGLAWSLDGRLFASGGNDNICCLFDVDDVLGDMHIGRYAFHVPGANSRRCVRNGNTRHGPIPFDYSSTSIEGNVEVNRVRPSPTTLRNLSSGCERHR